MFGLEGEFFFGSSAALERHFAEIEERIGADTRVVVLRLKRVRNPDAVALTLLEGFLERVEARGVRVLMGGVREHLFEALRRTGLAEKLQDRIFLEQPVRQTSTLLALRRAYELIGEERCATCPRRAGATAARGSTTRSRRGLGRGQPEPCLDVGVDEAGRGRRGKTR